MHIFYSPFYNGQCFVKQNGTNVCLDTQVLDSQGLLSQLALHAGIHHEIPSFPTRLTAYHQALCEYDKIHPENLFHQSIVIDAMSVAKTLIGWRDYLSLCGWEAGTILERCSRLNTLAEIEAHYQDDGLAVLLRKLMDVLMKMKEEKVPAPATYRQLVVEIPFSAELLPDYLQPMLDLMKDFGMTLKEGDERSASYPKEITLIEFSQQWKAEAWLSQQKAEQYDVWINSDNKRLDNWLHMSGHPVSGSTMKQSNPQITQLFLLAVQMFQRPLNVNVLVQYLLLPECPLDWQLRNRLAGKIIREGGFCNQNVKECINDFIEKEFKEDATQRKQTQKEREDNYSTYLPFDLRKEEDAMLLVEEKEELFAKDVVEFMKKIKDYASSRAMIIEAKSPYDARIQQLQTVVELVDALLHQIEVDGQEKLAFSTLEQWAQLLYEPRDFRQYNAQVGSQWVINSPSNMVSETTSTIWCDFYGDVSAALSTDFLSPLEQEKLTAAGVNIWRPEHESECKDIVMALPIHLTSNQLTLIACKQNGATVLPRHPLAVQIKEITKKDGDVLYEQLKRKEVVSIDNHQEENLKEIKFDAPHHPVKRREKESFSALEKLLQDPFDYVMRYCLEFEEASATEIKLSTTYGNVAHETIEHLFTAERQGKSLKAFIEENYLHAFDLALSKKGAMLLVPEHHLDKARLEHQLRRCVLNLADIIEENGLKVIECEKKEVQDLEFENGIMMEGYIDMVLKDAQGKDVIFDLKWTSKKNKHKKLIEENRAAQLAIYAAMLKIDHDTQENARTAFFVMPLGKIVTSDSFRGKYVDQLTKNEVDIMEQLRLSYKERMKEIGEGKIETADNEMIQDLQYTKAGNVFPIGHNPNAKSRKAENKYSDYKCFIS